MLFTYLPVGLGLPQARPRKYVALKTEVGASQGKGIGGGVGTEAYLLPQVSKKSPGGEL